MIWAFLDLIIYLKIKAPKVVKTATGTCVISPCQRIVFPSKQWQGRKSQYKIFLILTCLKSSFDKNVWARGGGGFLAPLRERESHSWNFTSVFYQRRPTPSLANSELPPSLLLPFSTTLLPIRELPDVPLLQIPRPAYLQDKVILQGLLIVEQHYVLGLFFAQSSNIMIFSQLHLESLISMSLLSCSPLVQGKNLPIKRFQALSP